MKKNKQSFREMWNIIKHINQNMHTGNIGRRGEKGIKKIFEEITVESSQIY